jgi:hypothetical protein
MIAMAGQGSRGTGLRAGVAAGLTAALALLAAGCSGASAAGHGHSRDHGHDHGTVVGRLGIPFVPAHVRGQAEVIPVTVHTGERFSVEVQTSDGPYVWNQTGPRPDPGVVRLAGDFDAGSCRQDQVGCRVPYYRTMIAQAPGVTTATWNYRDFGCPAHGPAPKDRTCPKVTHVRFTITVTS